MHRFRKIGVHYKEPDGSGRLKLLAEFHYETIEEFNTAKMYSNILTQSEHLLDMLEQQIDGLRSDSIIADVAQTVHLNCLGYRRNEFEGNLNSETDNVLNINLPSKEQKSFTFFTRENIRESLQKLIESNNGGIPNGEITMIAALPTRYGKSDIGQILSERLNQNHLNTIPELIKESINDFDKFVEKKDNKIAVSHLEKELLQERLEKLKLSEQRELKKKKEFRHDLPMIQDSIKRVKLWLSEYK